MFVHDTDLRDWERILSDINDRKYKYAYRVSGQETMLTSADDIFALDAHLLPSLVVWIGGISFNTYFDKAEQIVFNVNSKNVRDQETLNQVTDFMLLLGISTQKAVGLSPDNLHNFPFFRYSPDTERCWIVTRKLPNGRTDAKE